VIFLAIGAVALNIYAAVLIISRAVVYRTRFYRPMLLNIGLSIAPILVLLGGLLASIILMVVNRPAALITAIIVAITWVLLLPNASYLITELNMSHRRENDTVPLWYDIILVITLAMSGVVNTVVNVFVGHILFTVLVGGDSLANFATPTTLTLVAALLALISLGMYLGRFIRLNSWDVRHPKRMLKKVRDHFGMPGNKLACFGFTLTYAVFMGVIYTVIIGPLVSTMQMLEVQSLG
jgi:uncharacterized membrane protein